MSNNKPFEFSTTIDQLQKFVKYIDKATYNIQRKAMAAGGRYIASQVRKSYSSYFPKAPQHHDKPASLGSREPENLKKSVRNRAYRKPKLGQIIYSSVHAYNPFNPMQKKVLYGAALQKGFTSVAKADSYLTFQVDGKWKKRKQFTVDSRPWITEPSERAVRSEEIVKRMDKVIQREIDKLEEKYQPKLPGINWN